MYSFIAIATVVSVALASPINNKIDDLITTTYNDVLNNEIEQGIGKMKVSDLPSKMKTFIEKVGEHQLPLVTSQIKEEAKEYRNDLKQFVQKEVENYIEPLRIKEFVSKHLKLHKRDDEEMMPNYLDHFYGGIGK